MNDPRTVALAVRLYRAALRLYPGTHRLEYGALMEQLFRDQCRDALRTGRLGGLALRTLGDLVRTTFREHLTEQTKTMQTLRPSRLALILLITALLLLQWAVSIATRHHDAAGLLLTGSALALIGRAIAEGFRPLAEWKRGLAWGLGVALLYAFICPAWKHYTDNLGLYFPTFLTLTTIGVLANFVVPVGKAVARLFGGRAA
jgi:hypothetical protein